jgi:hypothetical protein
LEFEKGKSAIVVANLETLAKILKGLLDAVKIGELDHLLGTKPEHAPGLKKRAA